VRSGVDPVAAPRSLHAGPLGGGATPVGLLGPPARTISGPAAGHVVGAGAVWGAAPSVGSVPGACRPRPNDQDGGFGVNVTADRPASCPTPTRAVPRRPGRAGSGACPPSTSPSAHI